MKRLFLFMTAVLLSAGLALGQTGGDKSTLNPQPLPPGRHPQTESKVKKGHKGGKKGHKRGGNLPPDASTTGQTSTTTTATTDSGKKASKQYAKKAAKNKHTTKTDATGVEVKPGGPGVPPPTRPTDPK